MKSVTFYSYKGGVGRSLALANMARKLSDFDIDVFVMDFDLEAPGLTYKFSEEVRGTDALEKKGLVDYLYYFQNNRKVPNSLNEYYTTIRSEKGKGKIHLMTAGQFQSVNYWNKLSRINWLELFETGGDGVPLILDLKGRVKNELKPKFLLIDSRTGVTASASITLKLLADRCVVLAVNNSENLDGAATVVKSILAQPSKIRPQLNFILSRIPYHDNKEIEQQKESSALLSVKKEAFKDIDVSSFNYFGVIHHARELGWKEEFRLGIAEEKNDFLTSDYYDLLEAVFPETKATRAKSERLRIEKRVIELRELAQKTKDPSEKKLIYEEIVKIQPNNLYAHLMLAKIFSIKRDLGNAMDYIDKAQSIAPEFYFIHLVKAEVYADNDLYNDAIEQCEIVLKIEPGMWRALQDLGYYLGELAKTKSLIEAEKLYELAFEKYEETVKLKPDNFEVYYNWGTDLGELAKLKSDNDAEEYFLMAFTKYQRAAEISPEDYMVYYNWASDLGELAKLKNEYEAEVLYQKAFEKYEITTKIKPDEYIAYTNWGTDLGELAKLKDVGEAEIFYLQAFDKYKKALDLNPSEEIAIANWATDLGFFAELKDEEEAESLYLEAFEKFEKAIDLNPDQGYVYSNWCYTLLNYTWLFKQRDVKNLLNNALELGLKSKELGGDVYNLACVYTRLDRRDEALENLRLALERKEITVDFVKSDYDWSSYKGDDLFNKLIKDYKYN